MLTTTQAIAFLLAAMALTISPGPDNLMVLGVGMSQGRRHGIAFGLGCALGCLSHTALAALGISALIATTPAALTVLRYAGGGYLVWLGIQALRHAGGRRLPPAAQVSEQPTVHSLFAKGLFANAINPKVALFFLSFLPQFVVASETTTRMQLALLGGLFTLQAAVIFGLLGFFSGLIGGWLGRKPRIGLWLDRLAGMVFVALGLHIATGT